MRGGDPVAAKQWLAPCVGDDAAMGALRTLALSLGDGTDWSRADDHHLLDHLSAAVVHGRLHAGPAAPPRLRRMVTAAAPAPAPPPPPASSARAAASESAPPPVVETTFGSDVDVAAMVAVLQQAAQDGVPFCEECAKAAAQRQSAEATA